MTKWVVGATIIIHCTALGMLSWGVMPPDRISSGTRTMITMIPNCCIERAIVPRKMPKEVVAKMLSAAPAKNSGIDPAMGTRSTPCTTTMSENVHASSTTPPIDQIFAVMISIGETGIASKCSIVPCSRSRISAAPVRIIATIVTLLMISISAPNQASVSVGLKLARMSIDTGAVAAG